MHDVQQLPRIGIDIIDMIREGIQRDGTSARQRLTRAGVEWDWSTGAASKLSIG